MRFHKLTVSSLAILALFTSLAAAQTSRPKHQVDVPYVPTTEEAVKAMLKLADVKRTDIVYDLGCGDRRTSGSGREVRERAVSAPRQGSRPRASLQ
jgi:hypothetical protein